MYTINYLELFDSIYYMTLIDQIWWNGAAHCLVHVLYQLQREVPTRKLAKLYGCMHDIASSLKEAKFIDIHVCGKPGNLSFSW